MRVLVKQIRILCSTTKYVFLLCIFCTYFCNQTQVDSCFRVTGKFHFFKSFCFTFLWSTYNVYLLYLKALVTLLFKCIDPNYNSIKYVKLPGLQSTVKFIASIEKYKQFSYNIPLIASGTTLNNFFGWLWAHPPPLSQSYVLFNKLLIKGTP